MDIEDKEPKHISESLPEAVSAQPDKARAKEARRADLTSEYRGLVDEIQETQEDMALIGDPALPGVLDDQTRDAIAANRELEDLDDNDPNR